MPSDRLGRAATRNDAVTPPRRLAGPPLVLASASPRRREIVGAFAWPVEVIAPGADEPIPHKGEAPEDFVSRLSSLKVETVADQVDGAIIIGADTAVVFDGAILGKPSDPAHAVGMLRRLRGKSHQVVTGVTVADRTSGRRTTGAVASTVAMRPYTEAEIDLYVRSGDPLDKAGAYAVQDQTFRPAASVNGCYLNVVGLPLCEVVAMFGRVGASVPLRTDWAPPPQCEACPLGAPGRVGTR